MHAAPLLILAFAGQPDLAVTDTAPPRLAITEFAVASPGEDYAARAASNIAAARAAEAAGKSLLVCPCGDECECGEGCKCPNCPHRVADHGRETTAVVAHKAAPVSDKPPHLKAAIWEAGCVHGERWYADAYPELVAKGWRIDLRRVPVGEGVCPTFEMAGESWTGYTGKADHFAKLAALARPQRIEARGSREATGGAVAEAAPPVTVPLAKVASQPRVYQPAPVRRAIPPARRMWTLNGGRVTAAHLRSHGIDPTGMSQAEMDRAHSHVHEGTWNPAWSRGGYAYSRPVVRYSYAAPRTYYRAACPNGRCPTR